MTFIPTQVQLQTKYQTFGADGELEPALGGNESLCRPVLSPLAGHVEETAAKEEAVWTRQGRGRSLRTPPGACLSWVLWGDL